MVIGTKYQTAGISLFMIWYLLFVIWPLAFAFGASFQGIKSNPSDCRNQPPRLTYLHPTFWAG